MSPSACTPWLSPLLGVLVFCKCSTCATLHPESVSCGSHSWEEMKMGILRFCLLQHSFALRFLPSPECPGKLNSAPRPQHCEPWEPYSCVMVKHPTVPIKNCLFKIIVSHRLQPICVTQRFSWTHGMCNLQHVSIQYKVAGRGSSLCFYFTILPSCKVVSLFPLGAFCRK